MEGAGCWTACGRCLLTLLLALLTEVLQVRAWTEGGSSEEEKEASQVHCWTDTHSSLHFTPQPLGLDMALRCWRLRWLVDHFTSAPLITSFLPG